MRVKHLVAVFCLAGILSCCCTPVFGDPLNNWHWRNPYSNQFPPPGTYNLYGIAFANGDFYAVGESGEELISPDGTNWTETTTATTNQLNDIIYAGGKFVAVGNAGVVETSTDGTNWTVQNSGTTYGLSSVVYGNGRFVAISVSLVISSPDGMTWTPAVSGLSPGALAIAGGSPGFVALQYNNTNAFFSADGLNWASHPLPVPESLARGGFGNPFFPEPYVPEIVTYADGVFLVGGLCWVSSGQGDFITLASPDGINWPTNSLAGISDYPTSGNYYSYFFTGTTNAIACGLFGGEDFLQSSTNGTNWSAINPLGNLGNAGAYGNGTYVIVSSSQAIYTSPDSVNWTTHQFNPHYPISPTGNLYSIAAGNETYVIATTNSIVASTNDILYQSESNALAVSSVVTFSNTFVAVGPNGAIYQSTNGFSWVAQSSGTSDNLWAVTAGPLLVAVGDGGTILTSPTGSSWTSQTSGTVVSLYGVTYSNGLYVAVGQKGIMDTSADGINWTIVKPIVVRTNFQAVTYGSAGFLAAGQGGTILTSLTGTNWIQQSSGTSATLNSASFGNGYYLVTGANGVALTSPDGSTWTSRNVGTSQTLYGSAFLNGRFDIVGASGTVLESDPVSPLFAFQMLLPQQNTYKIFATPGMNYRIVASSSLTGPWSTVFTVNNAAAITLWTNSTPSGNQYLRAVSP
jgi:hypothetical protein